MKRGRTRPLFQAVFYSGIFSFVYGFIMDYFSKISAPYLTDGKTVLSDITVNDKDAYYALYTSDEENAYWGYDYREDVANPTPDAFYSFMTSLKSKKEEYSLAVRENSGGEMIGEAVVHGFTDESVELGIRILKPYQRKGHAERALLLLMAYAKNTLGVKKITAKCYHRNIRSYNLLQKVGFIKTGEDETYVYFSA